MRGARSDMSLTKKIFKIKNEDLGGNHMNSREKRRYVGRKLISLKFFSKNT
jgi:hypothetical protein